MVSHPETGSDSPIGSDRDRGRDKARPNRALDSTVERKARAEVIEAKVQVEELSLVRDQ